MAIIILIDSVCFVDPRQSTVDIVQCIGRSLRTCDDKKIAHIYVPTFVENLNDDIVENNKVYGTTIRILKNMKTTDEGITEYFKMKEDGKIASGRKILAFERVTTLTKSESIDLNTWITNIEGKIWTIVDQGVNKMRGIKYWKK